MARKAATPPSSENEVEPSDVIAVTSKKKLNSLLAMGRATKKQMDDLRGEFGQEVKDARENHHLDNKAFALIRWMDRQEPERISSFMHHFEHYYDVSGLRKRAESAPRLPGVDDEDADDGKVTPFPSAAE